MNRFATANGNMNSRRSASTDRNGSAQRSANPDIEEEDEENLRAKPEQRQNERREQRHLKAARAQENKPNAGSVMRSNGRADSLRDRGTIVRDREDPVGKNFEPIDSGNSGCHPPRNNSVATHETVTCSLFRHEERRELHLDIRYEILQPIRFASGKSNGTRLVSGERRDRINRADHLGRALEIAHRGMN